MQTRSFRGSGEPAWVIASSNACFGLGPDPRRALGPAASRAASTGRTHDRTRPMLHPTLKALVNQAPSTHDPQRHRQANFRCVPNAALDPANLTTGMSQGGCSRSSTKVMVNGWPATVFPSASVNGKDAHRLSVCATAMRYDERCVSDASLD